MKDLTCQGNFLKDQFQLLKVLIHQTVYRVNIFNTTCSIEVNGKHSLLFIDELSKFTSQMSNDVDYILLNTKIKEQYDILLSSINEDHQSSGDTINSQPELVKSVTNKGEDCATVNQLHLSKINSGDCLKCKRKCLSRGGMV